MTFRERVILNRDSFAMAVIKDISVKFSVRRAEEAIVAQHGCEIGSFGKCRHRAGVGDKGAGSGHRDVEFRHADTRAPQLSSCPLELRLVALTLFPQRDQCIRLKGRARIDFRSFHEALERIYDLFGSCN